MVPDVGGSNPLVRPIFSNSYHIIIIFIVKIIKSLKSTFMNHGPVVELVDTRDLGSRAERCEGSSPFRPTKEIERQ